MSTTEIAVSQESEMIGFLESKLAGLAAICPAGVTPDKVIQIAMLCAYKTPKILLCEKLSVYACISQATAMNLNLTPSAGEAYLIPRKDAKRGIHLCNLQIGYQGLTKCARASGAVRLVQARLVRKGDHFRTTYVDGAAHINHEPKMDGELEEITHAYATAKLATGETMCEVMTAQEIERIRQLYAHEDSKAWEGSWGEQAKKTVIRRLSKALPKSVELVQAIALHDAEFKMPEQLDAPKPAAITNGTDHGSGKYCAPEDKAAYLEAMNRFRNEKNAQWLDYWGGMCNGEIPSGVTELTEAQVDTAAAIWAEKTGRLTKGSVGQGGLKPNQIGAYTGIVFGGDKKGRNAMVKEIAKFIEEQFALQMEAVKKSRPELFEPQADDPDADVDDALDTMDDGFPKTREEVAQ